MIIVGISQNQKPKVKSTTGALIHWWCDNNWSLNHRALKFILICSRGKILLLKIKSTLIIQGSWASTLGLILNSNLNVKAVQLEVAILPHPNEYYVARTWLLFGSLLSGFSSNSPSLSSSSISSLSSGLALKSNENMFSKNERPMTNQEFWNKILLLAEWWFEHHIGRNNV